MATYGGIGGGILGGVAGGTGGAALCAATGVGSLAAPACGVAGSGAGASAGALNGAAVGALVGTALDQIVLFAKKRDIGQIEAAAKRVGMTRDQRREFGRFVEEEKAAGRGGTANARGDFTFRQLLEKAREFLASDP